MEALNTKEEAAEAVKRYAHLLAEIAVLTAHRDKVILAAKLVIQEKHQPLITAKSEEAAAQEKRIEVWARANKELCGEKRSIEFDYGSLNFRQGKRQLFLLARWTWDKVLKELLAKPVTSQWQEYIRRDPEVNAQKLLEDTKDGGKLPEPKLRDIGLRVDRDESFSIKTKPEMVARDCDLMP